MEADLSEGPVVYIAGDEVTEESVGVLFPNFGEASAYASTQAVTYRLLPIKERV